MKFLCFKFVFKVFGLVEMGSMGTANMVCV